MSRSQIFDDVVINNEEDISQESLFKFVARINNTEAALRFCVARRLIPNTRLCPKPNCEKAMSLYNFGTHIDGLQVSFKSLVFAIF